MKIGIVGLPNVGKSSLFNLLTKAGAQVANFPFTTIDRNVGMVMIQDERLEHIVEITKSPKMRYASIEFVDIAGLIKDAHKGEGLGNKFLSHIRDVDCIVHVLRCFEAPDVAHTSAELSPEGDYSVVRTELLLADLEIVERRIEKIKKAAEFREELQKLDSIKDELVQGNIPSETHEGIPLLTTKKEIVLLNLDDEGKFVTEHEGYRISVKLEEETGDFSDEERIELRQDAGVDPRGIDGLVRMCMEELSIILFYTIKGEEARAWPVARGIRVIDAAGKIHTDMQKGFIKAEVLAYDDFIRAGGFGEGQNRGYTKIEGKEYVVHDGDIILVKFRG
ncbi:MAG: redox-regulated ATPase YchF [candidate division WOR-3 bacterium]|nr:redox-regulated ATPase YchF [candidate division WOR-3 bacterium]